MCDTSLQHVTHNHSCCTEHSCVVLLLLANNLGDVVLDYMKTHYAPLSCHRSTLNGVLFTFISFVS